MINLGLSRKNTWKIIRGAFLSFFALLFIVMSIEIAPSFFSGKTQPTLTAGLKANASNITHETIPQNSFPIRNWDIENLKIKAPAAISVEIGSSVNKVLFAKDQTKKLPIASLTKLMTALVVLERYNVDRKITITYPAMAQEGQQGELKAGQTLSVKDLLYITLIESSNRSAYALSEAMGTEHFIDEMNETAKKLGLVNTHFVDSTGLSAESYSSAEDIATLSRHLFKTYPIFNQIINTKEYDLYLTNGQFHHTLLNTNKLLGLAPEVLGGKTGWTTEAKGCFMVIVKSPETREGNYIINVVLGSDNRFLETKNIIDWVRAAYVWST